MSIFIKGTLLPTKNFIHTALSLFALLANLTFVVESQAQSTASSNQSAASSSQSKASQHALHQHLLNKVSSAQQYLSKTEKTVAAERQALSGKLTRIESEVSKLREQTAAIRRLADEKTLSLSQLEKRLASWNQQQNYQQGLVNRFLQQHPIFLPLNPEQAQTQSQTEIQSQTIKASLPEKVQAVLSGSQTLEQSFYPLWQQNDVVLPGGDISSLATLAIGPIYWYWDQTNQQAGLASAHANSPNMLQSDMEFDSGASQVIASLASGNAGLEQDSISGSIVFDPTLSRAMAREQHAESVIEHLFKGGTWAIPIVFFGVFALSIALFKVLQLGRLPKIVRFTPSALLSVLSRSALHQSSVNSKGSEAPSPLASKVKGKQKALLDIALNAKSVTERDDQLFMQLQDHKHGLERWIGAIGMTAAVSPLLGLLGTVSGMIETFKMMTLFGSGDPEVVSGGIAQALVTTELGLVVAIPALILNALLSRKAKSYYNELESFAILVSKSDEQVSKSDEKITNKDIGAASEQDSLSAKKVNNQADSKANDNLEPIDDVLLDQAGATS